MPKEPQGRIPESIDFESVNREVDGLIQSAMDMLKDPSRGGVISATGKAPQFQQVDLSPIRDDLTALRARRDATNLQVTESQDVISRSVTERQKAIGEQANAESDAVRANHERAIREAAVYSDLAMSMGIRPEDIAEVAGRLREERLVAESMLSQIEQMQSVGLLDNPLEWLANQLQLPALIEPYNRRADLVNSLQDTLDTSIASAQNAAAFNTKAIPAVTAAQAKAAQDIIAAKAKNEQAKAEENLAKENISYAVQKLSNDLGIFTATQQMTQLEVQQNIQSYQSKIRAIDNAENNATRLLKAAELLEKLERTKGLDVVLANYDRIMGHPKGTTTRYNFERFGEQQKVNIIAIGAGSGGSNSLEAMINFSMARPGPEASPQTIRINQWLQEQVAAIGADIAIQRLDEKQKPLEIARRLKAQIDMERDLAYRAGNLFHELSPAEMIASGAISPDSKLAKILEPFANSDTPVPTEMIAAAIKKEFAGNIGQAAIVLSEYYRRNIGLRNTAANYEFFKIKPPEEYRVPMMARGYGNMFAGKLDLTNPAEAAKYLLFMEIRDKTRELGYTPPATEVTPNGRTSNFMRLFNDENARTFKNSVRGDKPKTPSPGSLDGGSVTDAAPRG